MAVGDKAAAKGLAVYASTQDKRLGYNNDNQRGDELADEIDARAAAVAAEASARSTADNLKFDASKIKIQTGTPTVVTGGIWFKPV